MEKNCTEREKWTGFDFFRLTHRLNRVKHFGLFSFWIAILLIGVAIFAVLPNQLIGTILFLIIFVLAVVNIIFLKIRRLHDFDIRAWWLLLILIPILGEVWGLAIFFIPGTDTKNRFGEKPKLASKKYVMMTFILPAIIIFSAIFSMLFNYSGISSRLLNWKTYSTTHYSIQFPEKYTAKELELYGVPFTTIEHEGKRKRLMLRINVINYKNINSNAMQKLIHAMGLESSLADSLTTNAQNFANKVLIDLPSAKNTEILLNSPIDTSSLQGRFLKVKTILKGKTTYIQAKVYTDKKHKMYYLIAAYYYDDSIFDIDTHIVKHFLNSFKLSKNKISN